MSRRALRESANQKRQESHSPGRKVLLIGALALALTGCDLFNTTDNLPTPAPIVFKTPTPYTGPTDTPIPFQSVTPTVTDTETPEPDSTPGSMETPTGTPAYTSTDTPSATSTSTPEPTEAPTPTPTEVPTIVPSEPPTPEQGTDRREVEATGTYAYGNYYDTNSQMQYLNIGDIVVARCVLFVQSPTSAAEINAWYRLDSPRGYSGATLYAPADTFTASGAQQSSGGSYDPNLAICPDSPLPPQRP